MVVIKINMKGVFEEWFSDLDASASLKACETGIYFNAQHKTLSFDVWNSCAMQCGTTELSLEVCKFEKTDVKSRQDLKTIDLEHLSLNSCLFWDDFSQRLAWRIFFFL